MVYNVKFIFVILSIYNARQLFKNEFELNEVQRNDPQINKRASLVFRMSITSTRATP